MQRDERSEGLRRAKRRALASLTFTDLADVVIQSYLASKGRFARGQINLE